MQEVLRNLDTNQAIILTAPPGWGKTYKLLHGIKRVDRMVVFIFPLRALCDEVYINALKLKILCLNIRQKEDYKLAISQKVSLIVTTPEVFELLESSTDTLYILDEFHLFYYWGDSFREKLIEVYMQVTSESHPLILLTATLSDEFKLRLKLELDTNYRDIYHINFGNRQLKNWPHKLFFYPKRFQSFLVEDYMFSEKEGCCLIFCQYREQVKQIDRQLTQMGYRVLSCVGGEAKDFVEKLHLSSRVDFIVATSVVGHGVNLPEIGKIYFTYVVENLDFYLQMIGRGGREGDSFEVHTMSFEYFPKKLLIKGFIRVMQKRLSNKLNNLIYMFYAN